MQGLGARLGCTRCWECPWIGGWGALDLMGVTRSLERIAEHTTNIAEDDLFLVKGIDVRQQGELRS